MSVDEAAAERAWRARRRRRTTVTLIVALAVLAGAFYYASTYFRASAPTPGPCTTAVTVAQLQPADVSVAVYNATSRRGLARSVATALGKRGFVIKDVANDPLKKTVKGVAELRHGPEGLASAQLLLKHLPGAVLVADKREGDTVDVVLGNGYRKLGPVPPNTTPTATVVPCPTTSESP